MWYYNLFNFKSIVNIITYRNLLEKHQRFVKFLYNINLAVGNDVLVVEKFIDKYNNNYSNSIIIVNIWTNHNSLMPYFNNHNHEKVDVITLLDFSNYEFTYGVVHRDFTLCGFYNGDSKKQ